MADNDTKFEGSSGAKTAHWSHEMYRVLFQYLSKTKGKESPLQNPNTRLHACEEIRRELFEKVPAPRRKDHSAEKIRMKIETLQRKGWPTRGTTRRGQATTKWEHYSLQDLFVHGTKAVNIKSYNESVLTPEERGRWDAGFDPFDLPLEDHSEEADSGEDEPSHEEQVISKTTNKGVPLVLRHSTKRPSSLPRERSGLTEDTIEISSDSSGLVPGDQDDAAPDVSGPTTGRKRTNENDQETVSNKRRKKISDPTVLSSMLTGEVSQEQVDEEAQLSAAAIDDEEVDLQPVKQATPFATHVAQTKQPLQSTRGDAENKIARRLEALADFSRLKSSPNILGFSEEMENIRVAIVRTVQDRLSASKVVADLPVTAMELENMPGIHGLVNSLLSSGDAMTGFAQLTNVAAQNSPRLEELACAVVGAAVTQWALKPTSLSAEFKLTQEYWVRHLGKLHYGGAAHIADQVVKNYVETEVKPQVQDKAEVMRERLDQQLLPLLCGRQHVERCSRLDTIHAAAPVTQAVASMDTSGTTPDLLKPTWKEEWDIEIRDIFASALRLRAAMDSAGGDYTFSFPLPLSKFTVSTRGGEQAAERVVLMSMFPQLTGRFQAAYGGAFGNHQLIFPGSAYIFDPKI